MHIPDRQLYIGGSWQKPAQGQSYDVYSPSSGSKIGTIPSATAEDVDRAVSAALKTYKSGVWSKKSGAYRAKFLRAMAGQVFMGTHCANSPGSAVIPTLSCLADAGQRTQGRSGKT